MLNEPEPIQYDDTTFFIRIYLIDFSLNSMVDKILFILLMEYLSSMCMTQKPSERAPKMTVCNELEKKKATKKKHQNWLGK